MKQEDGVERVIVVCKNAAGEPDAFLHAVAATEGQVSLGEHYDAAEEAAVASGYEGPFVCFDESEHGNLARVLTALNDEPEFVVHLIVNTETRKGGNELMTTVTAADANGAAIAAAKLAAEMFDVEFDDREDLAGQLEYSGVLFDVRSILRVGVGRTEHVYTDVDMSDVDTVWAMLNAEDESDSSPAPAPSI